jgi:ubiquitin carboxyl-terminal hydrolase 5/13
MEGNDRLVPVFGAGLQGLRNIGSSCYMNALLQALFAVPEVSNIYLF